MQYAPDQQHVRYGTRSSLPSLAPTTDTASSAELCRYVDHVLEMVLEERRLNTRTHAAWQVMHGVMAFGRGFPLEVGQETVSALDYLLSGGVLSGWEFEAGDAIDPSTGRPGLRAVLLPGSQTGQGHPDQWLGYLATCGVPAEHTIRWAGVSYTVGDLIRQVEWDVPRNVSREYSWTLMGLSSYRPSAHVWVAADGQRWSLERLVQVELSHEIDQSPCGGTHRLYGLALALNRHLAQGGKLIGVWAEADQTIQQAAQRAREWQNADGSFSAHYFARPGTTADVATTLSTTGHVFEFLVVALDEHQVRSAWLERAARQLARLLENTRYLPLDCGVLYHAAHGLVLYRERMCGPKQYSLPESPQKERAKGSKQHEPQRS